MLCKWSQVTFNVHAFSSRAFTSKVNVESKLANDATFTTKLNYVCILGLFITKYLINKCVIF